MSLYMDSDASGYPDLHSNLAVDAVERKYCLAILGYSSALPVVTNLPSVALFITKHGAGYSQM